MLCGLRGVVERDGEGYIGTCYEAGTSSRGRTVEEAFANLRVATWNHIERQAGTERTVGGQSGREGERGAQ